MVMNSLEHSYNILLESIRTCQQDNEEIIVENYVRSHTMLFSARQKSKITSLDRLLYELDKRLLISPDNIRTYLSPIVGDLGNQIVSADYRRHCFAIEESQNLPAYQQRAPQARAGVNRNGLTPEVRNVVTENIGRKWNLLGRQLSVPEARLDNLDERFRDHDTKMRKIFEHFEATTDPSEQVLVLVKALEKAKRKDIAETVERLVLQ